MTPYSVHDDTDNSRDDGFVRRRLLQDLLTRSLTCSSQPMASLQVRDDKGTWRYTRHVPGGIIVSDLWCLWVGLIRDKLRYNDGMVDWRSLQSSHTQGSCSPGVPVSVPYLASPCNFPWDC